MPSSRAAWDAAGSATSVSGWKAASWRRKMPATLPGAVRSSYTFAAPASCTAP